MCRVRRCMMMMMMMNVAPSFSTEQERLYSNDGLIVTLRSYIKCYSVALDADSSSQAAHHVETMEFSLTVLSSL
jgi:hypothetical protein